MEKRILGIDTGTNSLGWAIVERKDDGSYVLINKGVNLFQEGVKIEKGIESSRAAERTEFRSMRRHYWRRKIRKISLLAILSNNGLCPPLSKSELKNWRLHNIYPTNEAFLKWESTSEGENLNPYYFRHLCLTQKLDLQNPIYRYILGRALYHINQRRGFLSNRKESTKESDGKVKEGIDNLSVEMREAGCEYLGEYFYQCYQHGVKIRNRYTSRKEHFLKEFKAICSQQELDEGLAIQLEKAIFYQRPLKSQKGSVGVCVFERGKSRCPISHPLYEEFRMYSFINNIKVKTVLDPVMRPLTEEEKEKIKPLFYRKSKGSTFDFKDIAKKIAGRAEFGYYKKPNGEAYLFNYFDDTPVPSCPVTAGLRSIFGEDWQNGICEVYTLAGNKSKAEIVNDVWHVLFSFDDDDKLIAFAEQRLQLDHEKATEFAKVPTPQGYASLSLKAIRNILPYLKDYGLIYSKAVFLGNVHSLFAKSDWAYKKDEVIGRLLTFMEQGSSEEEVSTSTLEDGIKNILEDEYGIPKAMQDKLYHPSKLDVYPKSVDGRLGTPRISSIKNPMAMRSLFRLRKVVNALLDAGEITPDTSVHIEFARDLNDANRRAAIHDIQRENKKERDQIVKEISSYLEGRTPTDVDILKYQLWKEQGGICVYTGKQISMSDLYGEHPQFDIEHTVPRSVGGDSTKANLTLCDKPFNKDVKKTKLPSQLSNHDEILQRVSSWKDKAIELDRQIAYLKKKSPTTKEAKDSLIKKRHYLSMQRNYWRDKYERFVMTTVPEGFSRRQGTDISVISRYARLYLKSLFENVSIVKGVATSDFRKIWGIQEAYTQKERVNHVHHCIDAITIACIGHNEYDHLARYYHDEDQNKFEGAAIKLSFPKPWKTFVEDIKAIQDSLITSHYTRDNLGKATRKVDRKRSKGGDKVFIEGDTARGRLHQETFYGAIKREDEICYVVRKSLDSIEAKDVENIVDDTVRQKVKDAMAAHDGSLKNAVAEGIWMNREKQIPIKKVRLFVRLKNTIDIRRHRDVSRHEYKRQYHVANDGNYMMAIYRGVNDKGKEKREFKLVNMLEAINKTKEGVSLVPPTSPSGYPLYCTLKQGTMVLLYQNDPSEIYNASASELSRRLYKITGMSILRLTGREYGTITMKYHQEARPGTEIKVKNGAYQQGEDIRPSIGMLHTQFNALVQHQDFEINELGNITFIAHD